MQKQKEVPAEPVTPAAGNPAARKKLVGTPASLMEDLNNAIESAEEEDTYVSLEQRPKKICGC